MIGEEGEAEMIARLERRTRGLPVVASCRAAVEGLRVLGARRIVLVDPPWFDTELNALGRRYYESAGFEVVYSSPCGLPSSQAKITPSDLHAWVSEHVPTDCEAIVIGGNGFRAVVPRGRRDRRARGGPRASRGNSEPSAALGHAACGRCRSGLGERLRPPV